MQLRIQLNDGTDVTLTITPAIEVAFEREFRSGYAKRFREEERNGDAYWLAWECLRRNGHVVKPFGDEFLETLISVEMVDDLPNG